MNEETRIKIMSYFLVIYAFAFIIASFIDNNYEFLFYSFIMFLLTVIVVLYYKHIRLTSSLIVGLILISVLHTLGGHLFFNGIRLYDIWIIENLIRYDNLVHFIGYFVTTFIAYNLLSPYLDDKIKYNRFFLSLVLVFITIGIGALNEIFELFAVIFLNAGSQVGDYLNNAFDLVFNLLGSITACFFLIYYYKKTKKYEK
ncbi:MAG: DUF2238 domain-containing protein [Candidatus Nanoarchaeia archaeon]|nr:DUF2238 domain-containing protein [Candidatus Nanoarchaeia archaeon]